MDRRHFIKTMGLGALGLAVLPFIKKEKLPALPAGVMKKETVAKEVLGLPDIKEAPLEIPASGTGDWWPNQYTWYYPVYPSASGDSTTFYYTDTVEGAQG